MSAGYAAAIDDSLTLSLKWLEQNAVMELPDSVWDCPKDCPIWSGGLSLAQAGGIYGRMKSAVKQKGGTILPPKD